MLTMADIAKLTFLDWLQTTSENQKASFSASDRRMKIVIGGDINEVASGKWNRVPIHTAKRVLHSIETGSGRHDAS